MPKRRNAPEADVVAIRPLPTGMRNSRGSLTNYIEALEQQTATSEVLQVISTSPGDLEPVFQAMLENATRICEAKFGILWLSEGDGFRSVVLHNVPPAYAEQRQREPVIRPGPGTGLGRVAKTKQVIHVADVRAEAAYIERDPLRVSTVELGGYRTVLDVPMLKDNELIGVITIYRQEVRPFTDKQIALLTNFASQAVIAIENTRLLNELREVPAAADRHRRRAQGYQPVDVRSTGGARHAGRIAASLCDADHAWLSRREGDSYLWAASYGHSREDHERIKKFMIHQEALARTRLARGTSRTGRSPGTNRRRARPTPNTYSMRRRRWPNSEPFWALPCCVKACRSV